MQFVEIEGTLEELRSLHGVAGVRLQRGAHDLGGGRWRASATVTRKEAVEEIQRRGLTIRITMDEDEARRRQKATQEMMKDAFEQERAAKKKSDDTAGPKKP